MGSLRKEVLIAGVLCDNCLSGDQYVVIMILIAALAFVAWAYWS